KSNKYYNQKRNRIFLYDYYKQCTNAFFLTFFYNLSDILKQDKNKICFISNFIKAFLAKKYHADINQTLLSEANNKFLLIMSFDKKIGAFPSLHNMYKKGKPANVLNVLSALIERNMKHLPKNSSIKKLHKNICSAIKCKNYSMAINKISNLELKTIDYILFNDSAIINIRSITPFTHIDVFSYLNEMKALNINKLVLRLDNCNNVNENNIQELVKTFSLFKGNIYWHTNDSSISKQITSNSNGKIIFTQSTIPTQKKRKLVQGENCDDFQTANNQIIANILKIIQSVNEKSGKLDYYYKLEKPLNLINIDLIKESAKLNVNINDIYNLFDATYIQVTSQNKNFKYDINIEPANQILKINFRYNNYSWQFCYNHSLNKIYINDNTSNKDTFFNSQDIIKLIDKFNTPKGLFFIKRILNLYLYNLKDRMFPDINTQPNTISNDTKQMFKDIINQYARLKEKNISSFKNLFFSKFYQTYIKDIPVKKKKIKKLFIKDFIRTILYKFYLVNSKDMNYNQNIMSIFYSKSKGLFKSMEQTYSKDSKKLLIDLLIKYFEVNKNNKNLPYLNFWYNLAQTDNSKAVNSKPENTNIDFRAWAENRIFLIFKLLATKNVINDIQEQYFRNQFTLESDTIIIDTNSIKKIDLQAIADIIGLFGETTHKKPVLEHKASEKTFAPYKPRSKPIFGDKFIILNITKKMSYYEALFICLMKYYFPYRTAVVFKDNVNPITLQNLGLAENTIFVDKKDICKFPITIDYKTLDIDKIRDDLKINLIKKIQNLIRENIQNYVFKKLIKTIPSMQSIIRRNTEKHKFAAHTTLIKYAQTLLKQHTIYLSFKKSIDMIILTQNVIRKKSEPNNKLTHYIGLVKYTQAICRYNPIYASYENNKNLIISAQNVIRKNIQRHNFLNLQEKLIVFIQNIFREKLTKLKLQSIKEELLRQLRVISKLLGANQNKGAQTIKEPNQSTSGSYTAEFRRESDYTYLPSPQYPSRYNQYAGLYYYNNNFSNLWKYNQVILKYFYPNNIFYITDHYYYNSHLLDLSSLANYSNVNLYPIINLINRLTGGRVYAHNNKLIHYPRKNYYWSIQANNIITSADGLLFLSIIRNLCIKNVNKNYEDLIKKIFSYSKGRINGKIFSKNHEIDIYFQILSLFNTLRNIKDRIPKNNLPIFVTNMIKYINEYVRDITKDKKINVFSNLMNKHNAYKPEIQIQIYHIYMPHCTVKNICNAVNSIFKNSRIVIYRNPISHIDNYNLQSLKLPSNHRIIIKQVNIRPELHEYNLIITTTLNNGIKYEEYFKNFTSFIDTNQNMLKDTRLITASKINIKAFNTVLNFYNKHRENNKLYSLFNKIKKEKGIKFLLNLLTNSHTLLPYFKKRFHNKIPISHIKEFQALNNSV
ncbi:hypothetical protein ACFL4O_02170, partial [bacterium]